MMFGNNTNPTGRTDREFKDMFLDMLGTELVNDPNAPPDARASVGLIL